MNIGIGRISSVGQLKGSSKSLQRQKDEVVNYLTNHDLKLDKWIEDVMSGTTSNRDGLNEIRELIDNGVKVERIIVLDLTRLMRSFTEGVVFIKYLMDNDVKIISTKEDINTETPSGRFFLNVILSYSQMDRDCLVEKLKSSRLSLLENQNKRVSGRICYGYTKVENSLVVNEGQSKIVKYIFKRYYHLRDLPKTKRMRKLLDGIKRKGFMYKDKCFTNHIVRYILRNPFYKGTLLVNWEGKSVSKKHDYGKIISTQLFNKVQMSF